MVVCAESSASDGAKPNSTNFEGGDYDDRCDYTIVMTQNNRVMMMNSLRLSDEATVDSEVRGCPRGAQTIALSHGRPYPRAVINSPMKQSHDWFAWKQKPASCSFNSM